MSSQKTSFPRNGASDPRTIVNQCDLLDEPQKASRRARCTEHETRHVDVRTTRVSHETRSSGATVELDPNLDGILYGVCGVFAFLLDTP
jgi:hypothetical protein